MDTRQQDVRVLVDLARDKSVESRKALANRISDIFTGEDCVLSERESVLMNDILSKLLRDFEVNVRRELSERLATKRRLPRDLMLGLAHDTIEVARPILEHSELFADRELIEIVRQRSLQHQLAIAARRSISETVSDALVETAQADVIKRLLENQNARISQATMEYLVEESQRVDSFQEPLVRRQDLSQRLAKRLCGWVSEALRKEILNSYDIDRGELDRELRTVVVQAVGSGGDGEAGGQQVPSAVRLAQRIAEIDAASVTPDFLVQTLRQGEVALFEALFAQYAGLGLRKIRQVLYDPKGKGLTIVCRAVGIDRANFSSLFFLSRKARPGFGGVGPSDVNRALELYDRLKPGPARQVLSLWQSQGADVAPEIPASKDGADT